MKWSCLFILLISRFLDVVQHRSSFNVALSSKFQPSMAFLFHAIPSRNERPFTHECSTPFSSIIQSVTIQLLFFHLLWLLVAKNSPFLLKFKDEDLRPFVTIFFFFLLAEEKMRLTIWHAWWDIREMKYKQPLEAICKEIFLDFSSGTLQVTKRSFNSWKC